MSNHGAQEDEIQHGETTPGFNWRWIAGMVIAVVGVAAALLLMCFIGAKADAKYRQCQSNCKNIGSALLIYSVDNNGFYPPKLEMLTPEYLKTIPTCSGYEAKIELVKRKRPTYCDTYEVSKDFSAYTFYCGSGDHSLIRVPDNYPQYNSMQGLIPK